MAEAQFQLIVGETRIGAFLRKMLPVSYGLGGAFLLCALVPIARFLLPVLGTLWLLLIGSVTVIEFSKAKLYVLDGLIKLSEDSILLNGHFIQVADLQQLIVKFNGPRGQGIGRNGAAEQGNRIIIRTKEGRELESVVLLETKAQRANLAAVLKEWRTAGIKISTDGIEIPSTLARV
jgi:hypothetical protein